MRFLSKYFSKLPDIRDLPLKVYSFDFSLDKLTPGVDNIRYDVHLSPGFIKSVGDTIFSMVVSQAKVGRLLGMGKKQTWQSEKDEFKKLCGDIMLAGINRAKSDREIQIDFLAQAAIVKFITEEIGMIDSQKVEEFPELGLSIFRGGEIYVISGGRSQTKDLHPSGDYLFQVPQSLIFEIESAMPDHGFPELLQQIDRDIYSGLLFHLNSSNIYDFDIWILVPRIAGFR